MYVQCTTTSLSQRVMRIDYTSTVNANVLLALCHNLFCRPLINSTYSNRNKETQLNMGSLI